SGFLVRLATKTASAFSQWNLRFSDSLNLHIQASQKSPGCDEPGRRSIAFDRLEWIQKADEAGLLKGVRSA
ncbi:MAG: hypothetical protein ACPGYX_04265, partial [Oceanobacter sp.]